MPPTDAPVVLGPPRERCNLHGLYLRSDATCSRCESEEVRRTSGRLLRGIVGALVATLVVAFVVRGYTSLASFRAARAEAAKAKVAALTRDRGARVVMYTMAGCGACKAEKAWMAAHAVPYVERQVDTDPDARRELHGLTGRGVLPTTVVDDEVFVGFSALRLEGTLRNHGVL